jgi:hypothetical protein
MTAQDTNPEGLPIIPPLNPAQQPKAADGAVAICGACGLRIYSVMGYSCPRLDCPVFMHATFAAATAKERT